VFVIWACRVLLRSELGGSTNEKGKFMAVVSLAGFRSEPGRAEEHMALHMEAAERLQGMGMAAAPLQPLAGGDVGTLAMSVNYASNADWAASSKKMQGDEAWQEFYRRAMGTGAATQVESSLFTDIDPDFQAANRTLGVVLATQWQALPGRLADFMGKVMESFAHIERMGGRPRAMQSVIGAHPMTTLVSTAFDDLDAYAAYSDAINADAEWQAFWSGALSDPTAEMIRSGVYINMMGS
jgi:hypothetical protein